MAAKKEAINEHWHEALGQREAAFDPAIGAALALDMGKLTAALERLRKKSADLERHARAAALWTLLSGSPGSREGSGQRQRECVEFLLSRLDSSWSWKRGVPSPLHLSIYWERSIFEAALARAGNLEARTGSGASALIMAAGNYGRSDKVAALIEAGADVEARDKKDRSALEASAQSDAAEAPEIGRLLILAGACWERALPLSRPEAFARHGPGRQSKAAAWMAAAEAAILEREAGSGPTGPRRARAL